MHVLFVNFLADCQVLEIGQMCPEEHNCTCWYQKECLQGGAKSVSKRGNYYYTVVSHKTRD